MFPFFGGAAQGGDPMIAEMNRMMSTMHQSMNSMLGGFQTAPLGHQVRSSPEAGSCSHAALLAASHTPALWLLQTQFGEYRLRSRPPLIEELPAEAERQQRTHSRPHASGSEPIIQEPDEGT